MGILHLSVDAFETADLGKSIALTLLTHPIDQTQALPWIGTHHISSHFPPLAPGRLYRLPTTTQTLYLTRTVEAVQAFPFLLPPLHEWCVACRLIGLTRLIDRTSYFAD